MPDVTRATVGGRDIGASSHAAAWRGAGAGASSRRSGLAEQRVEKSVLIVARAGERRQELPAADRDIRREGEGFAQRIGVRARGKPRPALRSRREHRARRVEQSARRGRGTAKARRAAAPAAAPKRAMSDSRRSHLTSGCRRTTPEAVHGTSARIRSNGRPSHHAAGVRASPAHVDARGRRAAGAARFSRTRASRASSVSSATISTSASSARCVVLPPGAAQASSTRMPSQGASSGAASCAPASCTENAPSSKPGSCATGRGGSTMMPAAPHGVAATPASRSARATRRAS